VLTTEYDETALAASTCTVSTIGIESTVALASKRRCRHRWDAFDKTCDLHSLDLHNYPATSAHGVTLLPKSYVRRCCDRTNISPRQPRQDCSCALARYAIGTMGRRCGDFSALPSQAVGPLAYQGRVLPRTLRRTRFELRKTAFLPMPVLWTSSYRSRGFCPARPVDRRRRILSAMAGNEHAIDWFRLAKHQVDLLRQEIGAVKSIANSVSTPPAVRLSPVLLSACDTAAALIVLGEAGEIGFLSETIMLMRALLEKTINLAYLSICDEDEQSDTSCTLRTELLADCTSSFELVMLP
jgi:hypothetical protein